MKNNIQEILTVAAECMGLFTAVALTLIICQYAFG